jgi:hypothetical protein
MTAVNGSATGGVAEPAEGGGVGYSNGRSPFYEIVIGGSIARTQVQRARTHLDRLS